MSRLTRLFGKIRRDNEISSESDPEEERSSDRADAEDESVYENSHSDSNWNDDWSVTEEMMARAMGDEEDSPIATSTRSDATEESPGKRPSKDALGIPELKKSKSRRKKKTEKSSDGLEGQSSSKTKKKSRRKSVGDEESLSQASGSMMGSISTKASLDDSSMVSESRSEENNSGTLEKRKEKSSSSKKKKKKEKDKEKDKEKEKLKKSKSDRALDMSVHSTGSDRVRDPKRMSEKTTRYRSHSQGHDYKKRRSSSKVRDNDDSKDKKKKSSKTKKRDSATIDVTSAGLMAPSIPSVEDSLSGGQDELRREILRLHQMLSEALEKVATQTAEQIQDKDMFLKVSTELSNVKFELEDIQNEKNHVQTKLEERDRKIEKCVTQIENLTESLERQRADQALVEADLEQSEADVDKLLIKIEDLERAADNSGGVTDEVLRAELKDAKISLVDKNREVESYKSKVESLGNDIQLCKARIEELEHELEETSTVSRLQVEELEDEKKALQGRLKGERLDFSSKLSEKEETITSLQQELARYRGNSEFEDIAVVREELFEAKTELQIATRELESAQKFVTKVKGEKEDLLERNNKLNADVKRLEKSVSELTVKSNDLGEKVLKWTEQTYEWKARAETAEKRLQAFAETNEMTSDSGSLTEEAPQGLFLQAIMDKQESSKKAASRWNIFRASGQFAEEDQSVEEIRIKNLELQNSTLVTKNSELQSELVKLQSTHKDEIYNKQKQITQLEGENEALKLKNQTLEVICSEKNEALGE